MVRKSWTYYIAILSLCWNSGCDISPYSLPVKRSEVIGTYAASYRAGLVERIELDVDSTYKYYFLGFDSAEFQIRDKWRILYADGRQNEPAVCLENFYVPYPLVALCFRTSGPSELLKVDTIPSTYCMDVFKDGHNPLYLIRCPGDKQYYVKLEDIQAIARKRH